MTAFYHKSAAMQLQERFMNQLTLASLLEDTFIGVIIIALSHFFLGDYTVHKNYIKILS